MNTTKLIDIPNNSTIFISKKWGKTYFIPDKNPQCKKCILFNTLEECLDAPCTLFERKDGQTGYFSIHEMPQ